MDSQGLQSNIVNFSISPQTVEPMNFTISCLDTPTVVNNYLPNAQSSMSSSLEWKIKPVWSDLDAQVLVFFQVRVTLLIDTGAPPLNLDNRITYTITPQLGLTNTSNSPEVYQFTSNPTPELDSPWELLTTTPGCPQSSRYTKEILFYSQEFLVDRNNIMNVTMGVELNLDNTNLTFATCGPRMFYSVSTSLFVKSVNNVCGQMYYYSPFEYYSLGAIGGFGEVALKAEYYHQTQGVELSNPNFSLGSAATLGGNDFFSGPTPPPCPIGFDTPGL